MDIVVKRSVSQELCQNQGVAVGRQECTSSIWMAANLSKQHVESVRVPVFVLVGNWLIACCQVDDTQPGVAETHALAGRDPDTLVAGPAMNEALDRPIQPLRQTGFDWEKNAAF
jgi:hypothetical protein